MRRWSLFVVFVMMASVFALSVPFASNVRATTLFVGGAGPGNYTTIQAAMDDASPGDTVFVYGDGAPYYENIIINKTVNLVGENKDTTIIDGSDTGDVVLVNANWVNITGFTITNGSYGIALESSSNGKITGNDISGNWGGIGLESSSHHIICENNISSNDHGIDLRSSANNNISNNIVSLNADSSFILEWSPNNRITGNVVSLNGVLGIYLQASNNNTIAGNSVSHGRGITLLASSNVTISGNDMVNNGVLVWGALTHTRTHTIVNNTVNGKPLLYYRDCSGLRIIARTVGQLILANCTGVEVRNLQIDGSDVGITITHSANITVADNELTSNNILGVFLHLSSNSVITGNSVTRSQYGVYIKHSSNSSITANRLWSNDQYGILLQSSRNNSVIGNYVLRSGGGVILYASAQNRIHHNSVINNHVQAYDNPEETNYWSDTYPSGGNYWSDYTGLDLYGGPGQDIPGSDGIGDEPYLLLEGKQDEYPLIHPTTVSPPGDIRAVLSGPNHEDVTISWSLSPDDGAGLESVLGYEVHRGLTYDSHGSGYGLVATLPNGTSVLVDGLSGEGDQNDYFYKVCAIDGYGHDGCSRRQAGKFTRPLLNGPNLVSIPLIQHNVSIEAALQTVEYGTAWHYDPSAREWSSRTGQKTYKGELLSIDHTVGIWVTVTDVSNLTVAGVVPAQTTIHLFKGWNLIGSPSFNSSYTVADLKAELPVERVEGFDPTAAPHFLRVLQDADVLLAGEGYWVKVSADAAWIVSNG